MWMIVHPKVFHDEDMLIAARRQLIQCDGRSKGESGRWKDHAGARG